MTRRLMILITIVTPLLLMLSIGYGDPMETYQSRAESYYETGVDETALTARAWNSTDEIRPGMFAPDFSVMDLDGALHTLSQQRGDRFIVLEIGNAT